MDANIGSQVWTPGEGSGSSTHLPSTETACAEVWRFQTSRTSLTPMSRAGDQPARRQRHCRRDCLHQQQGQDRAFSLGDGSKLATVRLTKSRIDASVAVSDGMAYIAAEIGFVYGLG
jgi:hypothetical protein